MHQKMMSLFIDVPALFQAIIWTNFDVTSMSSCGIPDLRAGSLEVMALSVSKLQLHPQGPLSSSLEYSNKIIFVDALVH